MARSGGTRWSAAPETATSEQNELGAQPHATGPPDQSRTILALQATAGNRAVGRLLSTRRAAASTPPPPAPPTAAPAPEALALARSVAARKARSQEQLGPVLGGAVPPRRLQRSESDGEPGWMGTASKFWGGVKESAYSWMIEKLRGAQAAGLAKLRSLAQGLSPVPRVAAEYAIGQLEIATDTLISLLLAVIGLVVGLVAGLAKLMWGLLSFLLEVVKTLILFVAGFFDRKYQDRFAEQIEGAGRALKNFIPALRSLKDRWLADFAAANPDRKTLMIGELTGEVEALLVSIWAGGQGASAVPKVTVNVPAPAFAVLGPAGRGVAVTVEAGGPLAAGGLTAAVASSVDDAAKSGGKDKDAAKPTETPEQKRLRELEADPQGGSNPKSRGEAQTILQAEKEGYVSNARRPDLAKGEPNLDYVVDGGYAEIKTPDTTYRTLAQNVDDVAAKTRVYDANVRVIVDLKKLNPADKAKFVADLTKAVGSTRAKVIILNQ